MTLHLMLIAGNHNVGYKSFWTSKSYPNQVLRETLCRGYRFGIDRLPHCLDLTFPHLPLGWQLRVSSRRELHDDDRRLVQVPTQNKCLQSKRILEDQRNLQALKMNGTKNLMWTFDDSCSMGPALACRRELITRPYRGTRAYIGPWFVQECYAL
jgi:hypothetical protein